MLCCLQFDFLIISRQPLVIRCHQVISLFFGDEIRVNLEEIRIEVTSAILVEEEQLTTTERKDASQYERPDPFRVRLSVGKAPGGTTPREIWLTSIAITRLTEYCPMIPQRDATSRRRNACAAFPYPPRDPRSYCRSGQHVVSISLRHADQRDRYSSGQGRTSTGRDRGRGNFSNGLLMRLLGCIRTLSLFEQPPPGPPCTYMTAVVRVNRIVESITMMSTRKRSPS